MFGTDIGSFSFNLGGTYLLEQTEQLLSTDDGFDLVDTVFNPSDLKLRGSINWDYEGLVSNISVNYVDGYHDDRLHPVVGVNSWTTVDMNISYGTRDQLAGVWLNNTIFSLSALNIFDQDPPFVTSFFNTVNFNYDPANANPRGRTIAFQITKQW